MQQTPLNEQHRLAGAKLVDFAGWEMPIHYSGVIDEYHAVRSKAGLFDVSHMGRLSVSGAGSETFLQRMTTNDVSKLAVGQAQYSMACNDRGGIKDDIFVYRTGEQDFLLCVNASNREKIFTWMRQHHRAEDRCTIEDRSPAVAQIALQGPASREILRRLAENDLDGLKLHHACEGRLAGIPCFIARTGYTGEPGYEVNVSSEQAPELWKRLLETGKVQGLKPAGLGARDLLRLEMGYLLYGNDVDEQRTPLEAGAGWTVEFQKDEFIGRTALLTQQQAGVPRQLIAFELSEKGVPRHGCTILNASSSQVIGEVTSGNLSPLLQKGIGLGYVSSDLAAPGTSIAIDIRGKKLPAIIVRPPFYRKPKSI